jgi:hypothetical protein
MDLAFEDMHGDVLLTVRRTIANRLISPINLAGMSGNRKMYLPRWWPNKKIKQNPSPNT